MHTKMTEDTTEMSSAVIVIPIETRAAIGKITEMFSMEEDTITEGTIAEETKFMMYLKIPL